MGSSSVDVNNPMIPTLYNQILSTIAPLMGTAGLAGKTDNNKGLAGGKAGLTLQQTQPLLQPPPPQVLVIERMHSGENICLASLYYLYT